MKRYFFLCSFHSILLGICLSVLFSCTRNADSVKQTLEKEYKLARKTVQKVSTGASESYSPYIFIFNNNRELVSWGNNTTPLSDSILDLPQTFIKLPNGIYIKAQQKTEKRYVVYLRCLQHSNVQQSSYLRYPNEANTYLSLKKEPGLEPLSFNRQTIYVAPLAFNISDWQVFNPEYYASSSLNPSLGHLLINLLLLGILIFFSEKILLSRLPSNRFTSFIAGGLVCYAGNLLTKTLISLVNDGKLNFEFFNYTQLNTADLFAQLAIILLVYLFARIYFWFFQRYKEQQYLLIFVLVVLLYNGLQYVDGRRDLLEINWFVPLLFLPYLQKSALNNLFSWHYLISSLVLVLGIYTVLSKYQHYKLENEQHLIAEKLIANDDPVAEYLITENIPLLEAAFRSVQDPHKNAVAYLNDNLFTGYLAKYKVDTAAAPGRAGSFTFTFNGRTFGYSNRFNVIGFGFPELLSDVNQITVNKNFSEAVYNAGQLVKSYGSYNYPRSLDVFVTLLEKRAETAAFHHYLLKQDKQTIVVSYKDRSWVEKFAMVTYIFLLVQLALAFYVGVEKGFSYQLTLKQRIQFTVIGLVFVTVAVFAGMAHYYIKKEFRDKNRMLLSEKSDSVIIELSQKMQELKDFNANRDYLNKFLKKLSSIFFTDITLYDTRGTLIATSQPALFEKHILSEKIHPAAYYNLRYNASNLYVHEENIGQLKYLSAYRPFVNENNEPIAYINLPYFAKQTELDDQLSVFLVTVVNALVILLALALATAIFLSERITAPLKMLQSKLEDIDLVSSSTPIAYLANDEIGGIVNAYNYKVKELAEKVEQLSQNQKELAWREMAKQVAHEIKNPLTPMKLSAQHLQRTIVNDEHNWKERITNFVNGLVEQINTLTKIANEFSNYAQLPKSNIETFDLKELLVNSLSLYREHEKIELVGHFPPSPVYIDADKNLMLSVFNNLFKNAEQAIESNLEAGYINKGFLEINLSVTDNMINIALRDNGIGIDESIQDSIFMPNFTTKSSGMGLGLAMVKQIITQFGGKIWFETQKNEGSTFFIELPERRID